MMHLIKPSRSTTIVETVSQSAALRLPDCEETRHIALRNVTLQIHRTTEVGKRYADVTYTATLSVACAVESAEIDSQDVTGCVPCEHLFGLFGGTNPDDCAELRANAIRHAIRNAANWDGCEFVPFPLQHRERIAALLPALSA